MHKKYSYRDGKKYGPYLYENKRVDGKVVTNYMGKDYGKNNVIVYSLLFLLFLAIIAIVILAINISPTGRVSSSLDNVVYKPGEALAGLVKFNVRAGELIPSGSQVIVSNGDQQKTISIYDLLIKPDSATGNYYAENSNLIGSGEGFGVPGKKKIYPTIDFQLLVYSSPENVNEQVSEGSSSSSGSGGSDQQLEGDQNEQPNSQDRQSDEQNRQSNDEDVVQPKTSGSDSFSITGNAVIENAYVIDGKVAYKQDYDYTLENGQTAEIVKGSVKYDGANLSDDDIKLSLSGTDVKVSTDYYYTEDGFGEDYLGDYEGLLQLDLASTGIEANSPDLKIEIVYNGQTILSTERNLNIISENGTVISESSDELGMIKPIPSIRLPQNSTTNLDLSDYFLNALGYTFSGNNITAEIESGILRLTSGPDFKGALRAKITAVNGNVSLDSNEFTILVSSGAINVQTSRSDIKVGQPVKWVKNVSLENPEEIVVEIPAEAQNVDVKPVGSEESVPSAGGALTGFVSVDIKLGKESKFITFFKRIIAGLTGRVIDGEEVVSAETQQIVLTENVTDYLIEYETPAPTATETETATGKEVVISAPDGLGYTDVLSFTNLDNTIGVGDESKIKIYWVENDSYIPFDAYDLDADGKLDYIEWITPHLSSQTFDIIYGTSLQDGLVSLWSFEDNANDELGINNGTWIGNESYTTGVAGKAASFDGSDDYIEVSSFTDYNFSSGMYSVSAWVYLNSTTGDYQVIMTNRVAVFGGFFFAVDSSSNAYWEHHSNSEFGSPTSLAVPTSGWHHLVMTYDLENISIYLDGDSSYSYSLIDKPLGVSSAKLYFGKDSYNSQYFFNGSIDEVAIWNRTLTAEEITILYDNISVSNLLANGEVCTANGECLSGICGDGGHCTDGATSEECYDAGMCAEGNYCDISSMYTCYALLDIGGLSCQGHNDWCLPGLVCSINNYCTDGAASHECFNNNTCAQGNYCDMGTCYTQKSNGDNCLNNYECSSGACGANSYCTDGNPPNACFSDNTCSTGYCDAGTCSTLKSDGENCMSSEQCSSGICGDSSYCTSMNEGQNCYQSSCNEGLYCNMGTCSAKSTLGGGCDTDDQCVAGLSCSGSAGYCTDGSTGNACFSGDVCASTGDYCYMGTCSAKSTLGGNCDTDNQCVEGLFCSNSPGYCTDGVAPNYCFSNSTCSTGYCDAGTCYALKADGEMCNSGLNGADCISGVCSYDGTGDECTDGSAGDACTSEHPCAEGNYCDNSNGGSCNAKRIDGDYCSNDYECSSNMCGDSMSCTSKNQDQNCYQSTCNEGLYCNMGTCYTLSGLGGDCMSGGDSQCQSPYVCGDNYQCTDMSTNYNCHDSVCAEGNYCDIMNMYTCYALKNDGDSCTNSGNTDPSCPSGLCGDSGYCTSKNQDQNCYQSTCNEGLSCFSGICSTPKANGESCTGGEECVSGICGDMNHCTSGGSSEDCYSSGTCAEGNYCDSYRVCQTKFIDGAPCMNDYECSSNMCGDASYCTSMNEDQSCEMGNCNAGLYCDSNTCYAFKGLGGDCMMNGDSVCQEGLVCGDNYQCTDLGTGNNCHDSTCNVGNYCDTGTCYAQKADGENCMSFGSSDPTCLSGMCGDASYCTSMNEGQNCYQSSCNEGLYCDTGPYVCYSLKGLDGDCLGGGDSACQSPYVCGDNGLCTDTTAGHECHDSTCASGNYCDMGTCYTQKADGDSCSISGTTDPTCSSNMCGDNGACTQGYADQNCYQGSCTEGLTCSNGICFAGIIIGDPCQSDNECLSGFCSGNNKCTDGVASNMCFANNTCVGEDICVDFQCFVPIEDGQACSVLSGANACRSGICTEGVCVSSTPDFAALEGALAQGLVGYWKLNETEGTTAYDYSGNGNHGTLNNGTLQNVAGPSDILNKAYGFDGSDDYVEIAEDSSFDFQDGQDFTVSAWFKTTDSDGGIIVGKQLPGIINGFMIGVSESGTEDCAEAGHAFFYVTSGEEMGACGDDVVNDGQWHYAVGLYNGTTGVQTLYVDGVLQSDTGQSDGNIDNSRNLYFGGNAETVIPDWYNGTTSDVAIWNRALNSTEIEELYNNGDGLDLTNLPVEDTTAPVANITSPSNGSTSHSSSNNFTVNVSDETGLANATLFIYDLIGNLVNQTTIALNGALQATVGIVVNLADGIYNWFYQVFDLAGNVFTTENQTLTVETGSDSYNLTDGLVGYWKLNETSGTTAYDYSGNGNDGTLSGGVTQNVAGPSDILNKAYQFDGSDGYIVMNNNYTTMNFTVSGWFYYAGSTTDGYVEESGVSQENGFICPYFDVDVDKIWALVWGTGDNVPLSTIKPSEIINNWVFWACTYNGTDLSIYYNGALDNSTSGVTASFNNGDNYLVIGGRYSPNTENNPGDFWNGSISNVAIWNRSLNSSEIEQLYNNGDGIDILNGTTQGGTGQLVGWWKADGDATDSSGYGNNGTWVPEGSDSYVSGKIGQAFSFEGSSYVKTSTADFVPNNFSHVLWFKASDVSSYQFLLANFAPSGGMLTVIDQNSESPGKACFYGYGLGSGWVCTDASISTDTWYQLGVTYDGSNLRLYLNGEIDTTTPETNNVSYSNGYYVLGAYYDANNNEGNNLNGLIDDVRIYNYALNESEVSALYAESSARQITPANCTELKSLIEADCTADYRLMNNLDCSSDEGFEPICHDGFNGTFNGQNHTITGLTINQPNLINVGLFGMLYGNINNIGLVDVNVTGKLSGDKWNIGALVGDIYTGARVINSYSTGHVEGSKWAVGGLVGIVEGTLSNSYSTATVVGDGDTYVGGLAGQTSPGANITDSYATGNVSSGTGHAGGLIGYMNLGSVANSYATGSVIAGASGGGLVGNNGGGSISNSYWYDRSQGFNCYGPFERNDGCTAETELSYFFNVSNVPMDGWDFTNVWSDLCNNFGYPVLAWQNISDVSQCPGYVPVDITACRVISSSGVYILQNDIQAVGAGACINITSYNVTLDLNGYTIRGDANAQDTSYGIYVNGYNYINITSTNGMGTLIGSTYLVAIGIFNSNYDSISNVNVSNNVDGILLWGSSNNTLSNINAPSNIDFGISLYSSSFNNLSNINASNNADGIYMSGSSNNNTLSNINASNNADGIYMSGSSNNTLSNINASSNDEIGIFIDGGSSDNILNGQALDNSQNDVYCYDSTLQVNNGLTYGNQSGCDSWINVSNESVGLRTGLVGYWKLNETSGTTAYDYSGNGNDGTLHNEVTQNVAGPSDILNKAYSFDGSDAYIGIPNVGPTTGNITWSMWVYPVDSKEFAELLRGYLSEAPSIITRARTVCMDTFHDNRQWGNELCMVGTIPLNQWSYVVATVTENDTARNMSIYINGVYSNSNINMGVRNDLRGMQYIGGTMSPYYWNGSIDEVAIWDRTLNSSEIEMLYNSGNGINLVGANAVLNTPANGTISNVSGINFTGNFSSTYGLANATLFIYDLIGNLVNQTTVALNGALQATVGIVVNLADGIYNWFYQVFDLAGNVFTTSNRTIEVSTGGSDSYNLTNGLVGYWKLNETEGTTAYDYSGNGNDGTLHGGGGIGIVPNVSGPSDILNKAYSFDGSDAYIETAAIGLGDVDSGQNRIDFAVSFWEKTSSSVLGTPVSMHTTCGNAPIDIYLFGFTKMYSRGSSDGCGGPNVETSGVNVSDGSWHHIVAMRDSSAQLYIYVDGVLKGTADGSSSSSMVGEVPFRIAASSPNERFFNGQITNVALWNRSLSSDEVSQLYNNGDGIDILNGTTQGGTGQLVGWWKADGDATDSSGYGNNGTWVGSDSYVDGKIGRAFNFSGDNYITVGGISLASGTFAISSWIRSDYRSTDDQYRMWISNWNEGNAGTSIELWAHTQNGEYPNITGAIGWNGGGGAGGVDSKGSEANVWDGQWHNVVVSWTSGDKRLYIDGVSVGNSTDTDFYVSDGALRIGGQYFGPYHMPWIGEVDEVAIWNRSLSAEEIVALYQGGMTNEITDCMTISQPGTYVVQNDIQAVGAGVCINITSYNVTLDLNGHTITGDANAQDTSYGIYVNGDGSNDYINITSTAVDGSDNYVYGTISGFNYSGGNGYSSGIYIANSNYNFVSNVNASNNWGGIYLDGSSNNNILSNIIASGNWNGIYIYSSSNNQLLNIGASSNYNDGIYLYGSSSNKISNITASSESYGLSLQGSSDNNTFTNIIVNSDNNGIRLDSGSFNTFTNITASLCNWAGLEIDSSDNNLTDINASSNYGDGIYLLGSYNILLNITALNNGADGIYLYSSSNNNILSNITASSNGHDGISLDGASFSTLSNVIALYNPLGIRFYDSSNNILSDITASNNDNGIILERSSFNNLSNITASSNLGPGIYLGDSSNNNTLSNITALNNYDGIYFWWESSNNTLNGQALSNSNTDIYCADSSVNINNGLTYGNQSGCDSWIIPYNTTAPLIEFVSPTPADLEIVNVSNFNVSMTTSDDYDHYVFNNFNNSLVAWWRGENNTGDDSGNENNGTWTGSDSYVGGQFGQAMSFDGSSYVTVSPSSSLNLTDAMTVSGWVNYNAKDCQADRCMIVSTSHCGNEALGQSFYVSVYNNENLQYWTNVVPGGDIFSDGTDWSNYSAAQTALPNQWHFFAFTYNGSEAVAYLNGVKVNSKSASGTLDSISGLLYIGTDGCVNYGHDRTLNGLIDDVLIFNRSLSVSEVASLYNATANQYNNNFTNLSNGNYTIKGYAVDSSGNVNSSETRTISVNVINELDTTAPEIVISSPLGGVVYSPSGNNPWAPSVDWNDSVICEYYYVSDYYGGSDGDYLDVNCSLNGLDIPAPVPDGSYFLYVRGNDSAGNQGFAVSDLETQFTYDSIAPNIVISQPENGTYYSASTFPEVIVNYDGSSLCYTSTDNSTWSPDLMCNGGDLYYVTPGEGPNTWYIKADDGNGNIGYASVTFSYDSVAPEINFTSPTSGETYSPNNLPIISYTYSDDAAWCYWSTDNSTWQDAYVCGTAGDYLLSSPNEGENTVYIKVVDSAANEGYNSIFFYYDSTGPSVSITRPGSDELIINPDGWTPSVSWGDSTTCEYNFEGSDNAYIELDCDSAGADIPAPTSDGIRTLYVRGADKYGNSGFGSVSSVPFNYQGNPPTITLYSLGNGSLYNLALWNQLGSSIEAVVSGATTCRFSNNGVVEIYDCSYNNPWYAFGAPSEGVNDWVFNATDIYGNSNSTEVIFTYDNTGPAIVYDYGTENDYEIMTEIPIAVAVGAGEGAALDDVVAYLYNSTSGEQVESLQLYTDGVPNVALWQFDNLSAGDYSYEINATDVLVNVVSTGIRHAKIVESCLEQCEEGSSCTINRDCVLNNNLCTGEVCEFNNLTINAKIYTLYGDDGNGNNLTLNLTSTTPGSSIRFGHGNSVIFSGKNATTLGDGGHGGDAGIVNITVYDLFNTTGAFFIGQGGYTTNTNDYYGSINGGNGGQMQLNYHGLIRQFDDCQYDGSFCLDLETFETYNPQAPNLYGGNAAAGDDGDVYNVNDGRFVNTPEGIPVPLLNKNTNCIVNNNRNAIERDADANGDGVVNGLELDQNAGIPSMYNKRITDEGYDLDYDVACRNKIEIRSIARVGLNYLRGA